MDPMLRPSERIHHYWVHCLPSIHGRDGVLDLAIMALSAGFLGCTMKDEHLQQRAMAMYGDALRGLSTMIAAPKFVASDHVLAAVMCLGMAEIYSVPTHSAVDDGWASHNKGGCELLATRGSSILRSELGRGLLLRFRVTGLWTQLVYENSRLRDQPGQTPDAATGRKKPFPFANPQLRLIAESASQNYYDELMDVMVDIPGLLHDLDHIRRQTTTNPSSNRRGLRDVLARGQVTTAELVRWLANFEARNPSAWHCLDGPPGPGTASSHFPCGTFRFQNLLAAQAMTHLWAGLAVLSRCFAMCQDLGEDLVEDVHEACVQLGQCLSCGSLEQRSSVVLGPRALACRFADMICSTADYFTSGERAVSGPIILLFPLLIAKVVYASMSDDMSRQKEAFCVQVFRKLARRGVKVSDALVRLSTAAGLRLDVELRSAVEHAVAAGLAKHPTAQNDSRLI
jgi:hypothetical protein